MTTEACLRYFPNASIQQGLCTLRDDSSTSPNASRFLLQLAATAESAANSLLCSSILAGQGSEGDDYTDIGLFLGKGSYAAPKEVVHAIGLTGEVRHSYCIRATSNHRSIASRNSPARLACSSNDTPTF